MKSRYNENKNGRVSVEEVMCEEMKRGGEAPAE